jgi:LysR family nitrogen assimilation transcriptional regulator
MVEWLVQGRVDCAAVYNATPSPAVELQPVLEERLYLVSARGKARPAVGPPVSLAEVAARPLVIPTRPHAIRMQIETALAETGAKARIGLEIESVPAILDLVQRHDLHAVLSLNAVRAGASEGALLARPITGKAGRPLAATLWLATSAQRPRGALLTQAQALVHELLLERLAARAR